MKTQCQMVIEHINDYGSITSLEAINKYGITRLGSVIHILRRKDGYNILSKNETSKNKYGRKVTYSRYYFKENENEKN